MTKHKMRQPAKKADWPCKVTVGGTTVNIYRRKTPKGSFNFQVVSSSGFYGSYPDPDVAKAAADALAGRLNEYGTKAATIDGAQAREYISAKELLAPFNVSVPAVAGAVVECLKLVGDLPTLTAACRFYVARHKQTTPKRVPEVVEELLAVKAARGAAPSYMDDLRSRFKRVSKDFSKDAHTVSTADVQDWLDEQEFSPRGYTDFRSRLHLLFNFAVARGYASDNPVAKVERVKVRAGGVAIFTPSEITKLLAAASPEFLPCLAIGAFAGVRSAEIERLNWADVDLVGRCITIGEEKAKTPSRRVVPVSDNLAAWLAPYANKQGPIWPGTHFDFYHGGQQATAEAAGVQWKSNALRHSYASYRFALTGDAGRVAGELGNSAAVVHKHYRQLLKRTADAERWFAIKPEAPANVVALPAAANA